MCLIRPKSPLVPAERWVWTLTGNRLLAKIVVLLPAELLVLGTLCCLYEFYDIFLQLDSVLCCPDIGTTFQHIAESVVNQKGKEILHLFYI